MRPARSIVRVRKPRLGQCPRPPLVRCPVRLSSIHGMTESRESASAPSPDAFSSADGPGDMGPLSGGTDATVSLAVDMARMWVREHQKASMLGAFAIGVFTGAWMRD